MICPRAFVESVADAAHSAGMWWLRIYLREAAPEVCTRWGAKVVLGQLTPLEMSKLPDDVRAQVEDVTR